MSKLSHPVTGHEINVEDGSDDFWKAAGYRATQGPAAKKAPAKKSASAKNTSK